MQCPLVLFFTKKILRRELSKKIGEDFTFNGYIGDVLNVKLVELNISFLWPV